jgi:hypothetical protein
VDPATQSSAITALAAVAGSIVGGLASFLTTYFTQRHQAHRDLMLREAAHREELYSQFIKEAANVYVDSLDKTLESPASLLEVYSLVGRIRLISNDTVLAAAEKVVDSIVDSYNRPPTTIDTSNHGSRRSLGSAQGVHGGMPRRAQGYAQAYIAVATHLMKLIRISVIRATGLV